MQDNNGIKKLLSVPWIYDQFQKFVGQPYARKWLAEKYWRLKGGEKVVDIGCGPCVILDYLPKDIKYIGFDVSEDYICNARKKYFHRASFIVSTVKDQLDKLDNQLRNADLIICNGVLHHLNNTEAIELLQLSKEIMAPTGRLVCYEPVFLVHQDRISKWIMNKDRGKHIRTEKDWKELVSCVFNSFSTSIATGLIRIPHTYIIIEC